MVRRVAVLGWTADVAVSFGAGDGGGVRVAPGPAVVAAVVDVDAAGDATLARVEPCTPAERDAAELAEVAAWGTALAPAPPSGGS